MTASMISMLLASSTASNRKAVIEMRRLQARYLAEGALEIAKKDMQRRQATYQPIPATGTAVVDGHSIDYTITPTGFNQTFTDEAGIETFVTGYALSAGAEAEGHQATANRLLNLESTRVFQYAVFYDADLEIGAGVDMTIKGRVHTNDDMYLHGSSLTIDSNYLRAAGDLYRRPKRTGAESSGRVFVRNWVADPFLSTEPAVFREMLNRQRLLAQYGVDSATGYDSNFIDGYDADGDDSYYGPNDVLPWSAGALEYWREPDGYAGGYGHTVMTGIHGIGEAVVPDLGSIAMYEPSSGGDFVWDGASSTYVPAAAPGTGTHEKGLFHSSAGLSIITRTDGSFDIYDASGLPITLPVGTVNLTSMYDARQDGDVQITEIDVAALNASGHFPANGLLYAASYGAGTSTDAHGIRLVNGSELLGPLTVVSENSLYVQGDYNTVAKKSAAVIADAVNMLSNAWDNSKGPGDLPAASDTTYNTAIITGNTESVGIRYNGGFENLPRLHEDWAFQRCRIAGSFVNLWTSRYATGAWRQRGDRYVPPTRIWTYDTAFNQVENLPPFTPIAVSARDVAVF